MNYSSIITREPSVVQDFVLKVREYNDKFYDVEESVDLYKFESKSQARFYISKEPLLLSKDDFSQNDLLLLNGHFEGFYAISIMHRTMNEIYWVIFYLILVKRTKVFISYYHSDDMILVDDAFQSSFSPLMEFFFKPKNKKIQWRSVFR